MPATVFHVIRMGGLITMVLMVGLLSDSRSAAAACINKFEVCTTAEICISHIGQACDAGTPTCPGQFVCGSHTNCNETPTPVAVWCMVDQPE